jgi:hypothetical protein
VIKWTGHFVWSSFAPVVLATCCVYFQKEKMEKAIETIQTNFNTVRTGRANPAMLDRIEV